MKKTMVFLLVVILICSACITAFGDYKEPVDGIQLRVGLNPVVRLHSGNKFDYVVYARDMDGMTNGDLIVTFDTSALKIVSFEQSGNYDMVYTNEADGNFYISFLYDGSNKLDAVKLFVITFEWSQEDVYPALKADHIAGTFIKSVAETVVVDETDDTLGASDTIMPGDVDGNGRITAADARLALRISAKLDQPDERQKKAADVNGDGNVTSSDARAILRFAAGLENFG